MATSKAVRKHSARNSISVPTIEDWEEANSTSPEEIIGKCYSSSFDLAPVMDVSRQKIALNSYIRLKQKQAEAKKAEEQIVYTYDTLFAHLVINLLPHKIEVERQSEVRAQLYREYKGAKLGVFVEVSENDLKDFHTQVNKIVDQTVFAVALQKTGWDARLKNGNISEGEGSSPS